MIPISYRWLCAWLFVLLFAGCNSNMLPTAGTVSVDGQPVKNGKVTFYPTGGGRPGSGAINEDGSYVISYKKLGDGLPPGEYVVTIVADELVERKSTASKIDSLVGDEGDFSGMAAANSYLKHIVPAKYNRQETSPLKINVDRNAEQVFAFDLKSDE